MAPDGSDEVDHSEFDAYAARDYALGTSEANAVDMLVAMGLDRGVASARVRRIWATGRAEYLQEVAVQAATWVGPPAATLFALLPFVPDWRLGFQFAMVLAIGAMVAAPATSASWRARRGHWLTAPAVGWVAVLLALLAVKAGGAPFCHRYVADWGVTEYRSDVRLRGNLVHVSESCWGSLPGTDESHGWVYRVDWGFFLGPRTPYRG